MGEFATINPEEIDQKRPKTSREARLEAVEKRKIFAAWENKLAQEGMPSELPNFEEYLEDVQDSATAAMRYARSRSKDIQKVYRTGEHEQFARLLQERFGISLRKAHEVLEDSLHHYGNN